MPKKKFGPALSKPETRDVFINALRQTLSVTQAAKITGIDRTAAYRYRKKNKKFDQDWDESWGAIADDLESSALSGAINGYEEISITRHPNGGETKTIRRTRYPALTIFMLKKLKPQVYSDNGDSAGEQERANQVLMAIASIASSHKVEGIDDTPINLDGSSVKVLDVGHGKSGKPGTNGTNGTNGSGGDGSSPSK
jgi:hypothetical protein